MTTPIGKLLAGPARICLDFGDWQVFPVHAWELADGGIAWVEPPAPDGAPDGTAAAHAIHGPLVPAPDGVGGRLELGIGGVWVPLDPATLLTIPSPDGRAHACFEWRWMLRDMTPVVRCVILPGEV